MAEIMPLHIVSRDAHVEIQCSVCLECWSVEALMDPSPNGDKLENAIRHAWNAHGDDNEVWISCK